MDNTKLDNLISDLRQQKPILHDAESLTESIMTEISLRCIQSKPKFLIWVRVISSSAAVLLLGLLIYQQTDRTNIATSSTNTRLVEQKIDIPDECLPDVSDKHVNLMETYFCYMKSNSIKNQRLQSYYQQLNN